MSKNKRNSKGKFLAMKSENKKRNIIENMNSIITYEKSSTIWRVICKFAYPTVVALVTILVLIAFGIIYRNKHDLINVKKAEAEVNKYKSELTGLKEKIRELQSQEILYKQKKENAIEVIKEKEQVLVYS